MNVDVRDSLEVHKNPVKVIRQKCLDCCCGSYLEVDNCTVDKCPLYLWRMGKNPYRQRKAMSDAQRQALGKRLKEGRLKKAA
jgi:hypothetical protein